jgi:hypothetical protein
MYLQERIRETTFEFTFENAYYERLVEGESTWYGSVRFLAERMIWSEPFGSGFEREEEEMIELCLGTLLTESAGLEML